MDEDRNYQKYCKRHQRRLLKSQTDAELENLQVFQSEDDPFTFDHFSSPPEEQSDTRLGNDPVTCQTHHTENMNVRVSESHELNEAVMSTEGCNITDRNQSHDTSLVNNPSINNLGQDSDTQSDSPSEEGTLDAVEAVYINNASVTPAERTERFKSEICSWALNFGISHKALFKLMPILGRFTEHAFPVDPRTLLQTPRSTCIVPISNGDYCHFNFESILEKILICTKRYTDDVVEQINLLVGIDGLPISDSSSSCLWPILCSDTLTKQVHVIGVFHGYSKPQDANEYLQMFVNDITNFINNGITHESRIVRINFHALICDTPAKSFVLSVKAHTGYNSCTKCTINGVYVDRTVCFVTERMNETLRTDDGFSRGIYRGDYQLEDTILKEVPNFGCISSVPLDYMHVICLGVMKKLILLWLKRVNNRNLAETIERKVTQCLLQYRNSVPTDVVRKPRALKDFGHWKATEFRVFLLYLGPIALHNAIPREMYDNFLILHVAVVLLSRADLALDRDTVKYAEQLMLTFVKGFERIYGARYMSHNVHSLLHIAADVRKYGAVDEFSAFRFENHMQSLKKLIRKGDKPLQQLARRLHEIEMVEKLTENYLKRTEMRCEKEHRNGPILDDLDVKCQFKTIYNNRISIHCDNKNNCCLLSNGTYVSIKNIIELTSGELCIIGKRLTRLQSLYEKPLSSDIIGINVVSFNTPSLQKWPVSEIRAKAWIIPLIDQESFAVFPLLHSF